MAARLRQHSRLRRYRFIHRLLRVEEVSGFILDLGGGPASFFGAMFSRPEQVILLEVDCGRACKAKRTKPALRVIVADGEHLPLSDCSVSMTVCNSVIEHVDDPGALAREIDRVSQSYFLQTPNGNFPLETHSFIAIPFYHVIPWIWLRRLVCEVYGASFEYVSSVCYLSEQQLKHIFPRATITYETVLGLTKSYYVYRLGGNGR